MNLPTLSFRRRQRSEGIPARSEASGTRAPSTAGRSGAASGRSRLPHASLPRHSELARNPPPQAVFVVLRYRLAGDSSQARNDGCGMIGCRGRPRVDPIGIKLSQHEGRIGEELGGAGALAGVCWGRRRPRSAGDGGEHLAQPRGPIQCRSAGGKPSRGRSPPLGPGSGPDGRPPRSRTRCWRTIASSLA